jgi:hypothetical protein
MQTTLSLPPINQNSFMQEESAATFQMPLQKLSEVDNRPGSPEPKIHVWNVHSFDCRFSPLFWDKVDRQILT